MDTSEILAASALDEDLARFGAADLKNIRAEGEVASGNTSASWERSRWVTWRTWGARSRRQSELSSWVARGPPRDGSRGREQRRR